MGKILCNWIFDQMSIICLNNDCNAAIKAFVESLIPLHLGCFSVSFSLDSFREVLVDCRGAIPSSKRKKKVEQILKANIISYLLGGGNLTFISVLHLGLYSKRLCNKISKAAKEEKYMKIRFTHLENEREQNSV